MDERAPVLVVDDSSGSGHVLSSALTDAGLTAAFTTSTNDAIDWLAHSTPSLVVLDLALPPHDGSTVLHALREKPITADVPVLLLTALDSDEDVAQAFALGADDFVRKPFRPADSSRAFAGSFDFASTL